jgi:signal transduction histidine kinase
MRFPSKRGILARGACACLLAACICILHARDGQAADANNVLILFPEEGWSAPDYRTVYNAIKSAFDEADQMKITLLGESLDLYLFHSEDRERALAEFLREKYARERIDLIIPVANSSINFMLRYRDSIFPGIPMVYCGGVAHGNKRLEHRSDVTGTAVTLDIAGTIELARVLQPDLRRIAVVAGTGLVDRYMLSLFHEVFKDYEGKLELLDLAGLPLDSLLERVSRLPASTVILYLALQRDGAGWIFSSSAIQKLVSQTANVPLFNFIDTALGFGSVGGRMTQIYAMSRKTAEIALRVLSGESIASIEPAVINENPPIFDWRELKRWSIDESALPPGSIVRFKEVSPWGFNRWWIIGAFSFICLQTLLIFLLVNNLIKRKRAEEQTSRLRQQVAHMSRVSTVGQLGQNLAHEINQPLAAIRVNAEVAQKLLADEHPDLAEVRGALGDIVSDNQRAQDVVQRIRNLVKNTQPLRTRVDFNRIVADTLLVIQADAESKGVTIQQDLEKDLPPVHGDPVQLQQVILNLIINATEAVIQAQSPLRIVIVKTGRQGEKGVILSVSDTGTGVDLKTEKRLFEPFFTTKPQGLGLGLSISRSIVEAHDGSLSFSSNLDRGATFCIRLPVASKINAKHSTGGPIDAE